jgi:hypothetical protein
MSLLGPFRHGKARDDRSNTFDRAAVVAPPNSHFAADSSDWGPEKIGVDFVCADMPNANRLTVGIMAMVADGNMNGNRYYGVRVEGAKYGVSFGSALAIAISYTTNHSILWAIIHGILGWLYVIYYALSRS